MIRVEQQGLERAIKRLAAAKPERYVRGVMQAAVEILKDDIAEYPPATEANSPGRNRWYERGYGPRWRRKDGSVGGRRTSQTLGRKWTTRVEDRGMTGKVGNNVTYGPYVQHFKAQARFHKVRGWKTDKEVAERQGRKILQLFKDALAKAVR